MKRYLKVLAPIIILISLTGCFFFGQRKPPISWDELQEKQKVTYLSAYDDVWDAALVALSNQKIEEIDKESGFITTREKNVSASQLDDYAWSPSYGSFWYYENSGAMDEARYWINLKVSAVSEESTEVRVTPNFEAHLREWTWDTTSPMVWKSLRSRGVLEDIIVGRIARELGN
ncbi:hypothetical protein JXM67_09485 [candidate division WOR-3 bacterium]|nr:hypothetical protein [candidate division WOR-3 bacterium]